MESDDQGASPVRKYILYNCKMNFLNTSDWSIASGMLRAVNLRSSRNIT